MCVCFIFLFVYYVLQHYHAVEKAQTVGRFMVANGRPPHRDCKR